MKTNIQTLRTNRVRKAQLTDSPIDIHEVASLMDMVKNRSDVENESLMFSIHMN